MDELCCSICVDIFREPVSLPCHHSFCRECLRLFADKSNSSHQKGISSSPVTESSRRQINCPVCRSPAVLTDEGVNAPPVNTELCGKVNYFGQQDKLTEDTPMCSVCEETTMSPAAMFCSNCDGFFCQQCLTTMHPMKGPFKRHTVKPVNEILAQRTPTSSQMLDIKTESEHKSECDKHSQLLSIYCVTCKDVVCLDCLEEHPEHSCLDIKTAFAKAKMTFERNTKKVTNIITEIQKAIAGFNRLQNDTKANQKLHYKDIENAYTAALGVLNNWKRNSLDSVRKKHSDWNLECSSSLRCLNMQLKTMETVQQSCQQFLSSAEVEFLLH
ncbi:probable E3 ubiquitin-protein ligase MID2 [Liolophura sinensis]|uniref:probable E3 ubiquitin-protein ligase MID2 n=1 Tax=Liolophura sinensis TaxID=3198878 RepID=UPI0031587F45